MQPLTTFDTNPHFLHLILNDVQEGNIQLPDFQRGWIWDDDHIRSLLASVSLSYPIGAVMLMAPATLTFGSSHVPSRESN